MRNIICFHFLIDTGFSSIRVSANNVEALLLTSEKSKVNDQFKSSTSPFTCFLRAFLSGNLVISRCLEIFREYSRRARRKQNCLRNIWLHTRAPAVWQDPPEPKDVENLFIFKSCIHWQWSWKRTQKMGKNSIFN